jgi:DNA-binding NtrC family response regulator
VPLPSEERFEKNKKILIVDDDEAILHLLKGFFVRKGFRVSVAKDGLGAMESLKVEHPAIVLTDLKMPSFSGIDLVQFMHQNTNETPIVVMTAYPYLYPQEWNGNEVKAYFVKPFDIDEMFLSIQRILEG